MVSEEECFRTIEENGYYVILPVLPELKDDEEVTAALTSEYSSKDDNISIDDLRTLLADANSEIQRFIDGN